MMETDRLIAETKRTIAHLQTIFDELGLTDPERLVYENNVCLFADVVDTMRKHCQIALIDKDKMILKASKIREEIWQMKCSLRPELRDGAKLDRTEIVGASSRVPLADSLRALESEHATLLEVFSMHKSRAERLVSSLQSYMSHLEPDFFDTNFAGSMENVFSTKDQDLSSAFIRMLDCELSRAYHEYVDRTKCVQDLGTAIVNLEDEFGAPQTPTGRLLRQHYKSSPEKLGLHVADIQRLQHWHEELQLEKESRQAKLQHLISRVQDLWTRLDHDRIAQRDFQDTNRGHDWRVFRSYEAELHRLEELKRQNLHIFVEDARCRIQDLWDDLLFSEEEMLAFRPAFTDVYSETLLFAHEAEVSRLQAMKSQRAPVLKLIKEHRALIKDRELLAAISQDASRLLIKSGKGGKRDPTRLLREEKMRKKTAKDLPKVETALRCQLARWKADHGEEFLVNGEQYFLNISSPHTGREHRVLHRSAKPERLPFCGRKRVNLVQGSHTDSELSDNRQSLRSLSPNAVGPIMSRQNQSSNTMSNRLQSSRLKASPLKSVNSSGTASLSSRNTIKRLPSSQSSFHTKDRRASNSDERIAVSQKPHNIDDREMLVQIAQKENIEIAPCLVSKAAGSAKRRAHEQLPYLPHSTTSYEDCEAAPTNKSLNLDGSHLSDASQSTGSTPAFTSQSLTSPTENWEIVRAIAPYDGAHLHSHPIVIPSI